MAPRTKSGKFSGYRSSYWKIVLVLTVTMLIKIGAAQNDSSSCVNSIVPCANYLNATTKPPDSCCVPLLNAIKTQQQCLCSLVNSSIAKQLNINVTQALNVPRLCGDTNITLNSCSNVTATAPSASTTPSGSTPSGNGSGVGATPLQILLPLLAVLFLGGFNSVP
ncbi:non-specific lipid transfer protein GPI-anchored 3 isoform X2 [Cryptomeria japonica]|uniref:non-specific lipid transfer protein GPI-anchored 3 isoform X2 n=1 Tax=Cryptomeria japonica TaxID=3369 RepID=UPI0025AD8839|nr:non-specific lipid transfer protein GPI-anchored 3 isoform X2 [Cryptomeria japonica]